MLRRTAGRFLVLALVAAGIFAAEARGAGFSLQDFDAKALGMSNAFTAVADNPSAVYFNPAAIGQLDGLQGEATILLINPNQDYEAAPGEGANAHGKIDLLPVPSFFGTAEIAENLFVGVGAFVPFGLSIDWGNKWPGRYIVDEASIEVLETNGNVGVKLAAGEHLFSFAAGASIITAKLRIKRNIDQRAFGQRDGYAELHLGTESEHISWRWNLAAFASLFDGAVRLGVSYRDAIHDLTATGRIEFINLGPQLAAALPRASAARASTPLPNELRVGIAVDPVESLTISLDYKWTNWSVLSDVPVQFFRRNGQKDFSVLRFDWEDASFVALGAEYRAIEDFLAVRGGVFWDKTPANLSTISPTLPDNDRIGFSLGVGIEPMKFAFIDLAYMFVQFKSVRKDNDIGAEVGLGTPRGQGKYETFAHLFALTAGLKF